MPQGGPESSISSPLLHQIGELLKDRAIAIKVQLGNLAGHSGGVGVTGEVAAPVGHYAMLALFDAGINGCLKRVQRSRQQRQHSGFQPW